MTEEMGFPQFAVPPAEGDHDESNASLQLYLPLLSPQYVSPAAVWVFCIQILTFFLNIQKSLWPSFSALISLPEATEITSLKIRFPADP